MSTMQVPATLLLTQIHDRVPGKAEENGPVPWASATQVGKPDEAPSPECYGHLGIKQVEISPILPQLCLLKTQFFSKTTLGIKPLTFGL